MFTLSEVFKKHLRPQENEANAHGFNCAYLGVDKVNPYPPNTIDHKQWEWGWNEGIDLVNELNNTPMYETNDYNQRI